MLQQKVLQVFRAPLPLSYVASWMCAMAQRGFRDSSLNKRFCDKIEQGYMLLRSATDDPCEEGYMAAELAHWVPRFYDRVAAVCDFDILQFRRLYDTTYFHPGRVLVNRVIIPVWATQRQGLVEISGGQVHMSGVWAMIPPRACIFGYLLWGAIPQPAQATLYAEELFFEAFERHRLSEPHIRDRLRPRKRTRN